MEFEGALALVAGLYVLGNLPEAIRTYTLPKEEVKKVLVSN